MMTLRPHTQWFRRFLKNEEGNVMILFGLGLLFLVGIAGAGIDLGRQQINNVKLQQAADAASVSAGSLTKKDGSAFTEGELEGAGRRYFYMNYATDINSTAPVPTVKADLAAKTLQVTSSTETINTYFVRNFKNGIATLDTKGDSTVQVANTETDYDVVVVMDESGSTRCKPNERTNCEGVPVGQRRIDDLKSQLAIFLKKMVPPGNTNRNTRMGMIGYSSWITNVWGLSSNATDVQKLPTYLKPHAGNYDHYAIKAGGIMLQGGNGGVDKKTYSWSDLFVAAPLPSSCQAMQAYCNAEGLDWFNANDVGSGWANAFLAAAGDASSVRQSDKMSIPAPATTRADGKPLSKLKYLIFITDGDIMEQPPLVDGSGKVIYHDESAFKKSKNYTPDYIVPFKDAANNFEWHQQQLKMFTDVCTAVKNKNGAADQQVIVMTAVFGNDPIASNTEQGVPQIGPMDVQALKDCASTNPTTGQPYYVNATDPSQLQVFLEDAFKTITSIRIIK